MEDFVLRNWFKACRLATQKRVDVALGVRRQEGSLLAGPCLWERSGFFFSPHIPSVDWMRPTPTMEDNLLYSKSTDVNVNLI